jgi:hypothetical protein
MQGLMLARQALSLQLHLNPLSFFLFYKCIYTSRVYRLLCLFFPSISRVAIVSKSFEGQTDRTEEWYGTQYKQEAIPDEVIQVRLNHLEIRLMSEEP